MKAQIQIFLVSLLIVVSLPIASNAQRPMNRQRINPAGQNAQQRPQKEQLEAQRIAFITRQLQLTPAEAKAFWPVYNEFEAKRRELRKNFKDSNNMQMSEIDKLSDKEASQLLDDQIIEAQKLLDLRKEYHGQFKSVIPPVKVLKLYSCEREFQKMLIDRLRQNRQNGQKK